MDTKLTLIVAGVLGAALLASVVYGLADGARFVGRRGTLVLRKFAIFFIANSPISTRARGQFSIKLGRR